MKKNAIERLINEIKKLVTHEEHVEENSRAMDRRRSSRFRSIHKGWECYSGWGRWHVQPSLSYLSILLSGKDYFPFLESNHISQCRC